MAILSFVQTIPVITLDSPISLHGVRTVLAFLSNGTLKTAIEIPVWDEASPATAKLEVFCNLLVDKLLVEHVDEVAVLTASAPHSVLCKEKLQLSAAFRQGFDSLIYVSDFSYEKPRRVAAFTHVYNEGPMLEVWASYYAKLLGSENVYVIDHGSTNGTLEQLKTGVQKVRIPRGKVDHMNISKFCSHFQRFLLTQYEWVIHTDCDEFLVHTESENSLLSYIESFPQGSTLKPGKAFDVIHDPQTESPIDFSIPITLQRKRLKENPHFEKPAVSSKPTTWLAGFHECCDERTSAQEMWLIHAKYIDVPFCIERNQTWKSLEQTDLDKLICTIHSTPYVQASPETLEQHLLKKLEGSIPAPDWLKGRL